jgi:hypothetical protein
VTTNLAFYVQFNNSILTIVPSKRFEIELWGELNRVDLLISEQNFLGGAITAAIGGNRYFTDPDLTAPPSAGYRELSAGTIEDVFL